MRYFLVAIAAVSAWVFNPAIVFAAKNNTQTEALQAHVFMEQLATLNRIAPLQNPRYERAEDILDRRITDNRNKAIGEVKDVVLHESAYVSSLLVDFDRLHLSQEVFLNYEAMSIHGTADGYRLAFDSAQIEDMYPELLANIETASGRDGSLVSLSDLQGMTIRNARGSKIGAVKDVLFLPDGRFVEALYVAVDYGTIRNVGVAIPFDWIAFRKDRQWKSATLDKEKAQALVDFARSR